MLTVFLNGHDYETETPWFYEGTTVELFRTVRVIDGQVVFVEVSPGHLINVAHIERIADDEVGSSPPPDVEAWQQRNQPTPNAECDPTGPGICLHGYLEGTCTRCATEAGTTLSEQTRL